jgi:hypothetical protein
MKRILLSLFLSVIIIPKMIAQADTTAAYYDKIKQSLKYESGKITLSEGEGIVNVPKGFKFLNGEQTQHVLTDLWGNPEDKSVLDHWFLTEKALRTATAGYL